MIDNINADNYRITVEEAGGRIYATLYDGDIAIKKCSISGRKCPSEENAELSDFMDDAKIAFNRLMIHGTNEPSEAGA